MTLLVCSLRVAGLRRVSPCSSRQVMKRNIDESTIWAYLLQLLDGLHAIHSKKIVHRGVAVVAFAVALVWPCAFMHENYCCRGFQARAALYPLGSLGNCRY